MRFASPLIFMALVACSKKEPPPPERTEPWLAQPTASATASVRHGYVVSPRIDARIELPAKEQTPRGRLRVARGRLDVDLANLSATRGTLEIDVASIEMEEAGDLSAEAATREAKNWLDVGSSRPEAERERMRWAKFELTSIEDLSATAAHSGKREKRRASVLDAGEDAEAGANDAGEERSVTLTAKGRLTLHGFRVELGVPLRVTFIYPGEASPEQPPTALRIETRRSVPIALSAHDIAPRDATGVAVTDKVAWIGRLVGKEARVQVTVNAASAP